MERSRWTKKRLALAAHLSGRGENESSIARHAAIGSTMAAVRDQLRAVGLSARVDDNRERFVAVPARLFSTFAAVCRARGRREGSEDLIARLISVLAEEPALIANVLDDVDDAGFDGRLRAELAKLADVQAGEAFKMDRSRRSEEKREMRAAAALGV